MSKVRKDPADPGNDSVLIVFYFLCYLKTGKLFFEKLMIGCLNIVYSYFSSIFVCSNICVLFFILLVCIKCVPSDNTSFLCKLA